jgi:hypothetical protein
MRRLGAGLVLIGLAWLSFQRAHIWTSNRTVWEAAILAQPTSPRAWVNVGTARFHDNDHEGARAAWRQAWRVAYDREPQAARMTAAIVLSNLALLEASEGQVWAARAYAAEVVRRFPTWPPGHDVCAKVACLN